MPVGVHRFDHASNDEFSAAAATWREQHLKVVLAVLATLEFVEDSFGERAETLSAAEIHKT